MGARVELPGGTIVTTNAPGVTVESDERTTHALIRRLSANASAPLYPTVDDRVTWPKQEPYVATLRPSLYVIESMTPRQFAVAGPQPKVNRFRYLEVTPGQAEWIDEATSLRKLGAVEALKALGLDDAAVSLTMGDLDAARVQWLRWKDGV
ncbi:MAG: hypothetical protein JNM69_11225 [Archangium sp.]|nr:hypothetical protein [Archangium sp.]